MYCRCSGKTLLNIAVDEKQVTFFYGSGMFRVCGSEMSSALVLVEWNCREVVVWMR